MKQGGGQKRGYGMFGSSSKIHATAATVISVSQSLCTLVCCHRFAPAVLYFGALWIALTVGFSQFRFKGVLWFEKVRISNISTELNIFAEG